MNNLSIKPNFFIVGAPKCGTTSIYEYLRKHPEVFMPSFKEPHFFGSDLVKNNNVYIDNETKYLDLFINSNGKKMIGEASTHYLYSKMAAKEIFDFNQKSKIIILLRNPINLIYSLHSQYVFSGNENILDFEKAMNAEKYRLLGKDLPPLLDLQEKVFYKSYINRLPDQIKTYRELFKDNLLVLFLEDIKEDIEKTYHLLLKFLDLKINFSPDFTVHNPNKIYRSKFLKDTLKKYGLKLGEIRKILSNKPLGIIKTIERLNTDIKKREPLKEELYISLRNEFLPTIEKLEKLLQRDLSHWKK